MAKFSIELQDMSTAWVIVEAATKEEALKKFEEGEEGEDWDWEGDDWMSDWQPTGKIEQE